MKAILRVLALSMALIGPSVLADSSIGSLGNCLVDHLTGKERKNLAKWIFLSMAAHPEIKSFSNASPKDIDESDRYVGSLITRLLTDDCPSELKKASSSGPLAARKAFELVGQVAMQELMTNQDVMKSISNYAQYADREKISRILNEK